MGKNVYKPIQLYRQREKADEWQVLQKYQQNSDQKSSWCGSIMIETEFFDMKSFNYLLSKLSRYLCCFHIVRGNKSPLTYHKHLKSKTIYLCMAEWPAWLFRLTESYMVEWPNSKYFEYFVVLHLMNYSIMVHTNSNQLRIASFHSRFYLVPK